MGRIIAIGGGEISYGETFDIDKTIVEATGKDKPQLLFIPTASEDAEAYIESVKVVFADKLGCQFSVLKLIESPPSDREIRDSILSADIIYVGGGNTKRMLGIWRQYSVDDYLREAFDKGVILSGLSAGSICWFDYGHSDSDTLASGEIQPYSMVAGLGLIPMIHCPHYNEEGRAGDFSIKIKATGRMGLALDNYTAIDILDDTYRILKVDRYAKAYKVFPRDNVVVIEALEASREFEDISKLYSMSAT